MRHHVPINNLINFSKENRCMYVCICVHLLLSLPSGVCRRWGFTRCLHLRLSLIVSRAVLKSMSFAARSCLTLSIHVFACLPLLLSKYCISEEKEFNQIWEISHTAILFMHSLSKQSLGWCCTHPVREWKWLTISGATKNKKIVRIIITIKVILMKIYIAPPKHRWLKYDKVEIQPLARQRQRKEKKLLLHCVLLQKCQSINQFRLLLKADKYTSST